MKGIVDEDRVHKGGNLKAKVAGCESTFVPGNQMGLDGSFGASLRLVVDRASYAHSLLQDMMKRGH